MILVGAVIVLVLWLQRSKEEAARKALRAAQAQAANTLVQDVSPSGETQAAEDAAAMEAQIQTWMLVRKELEIAAALTAEEQFEKGAFRLESALEKNPQNVDLKMALANMYLEQKRYSQARELLVEVLDADPNRHAARVALTHVLLSQKNPEAALLAAKWILAADPYSSEAHDLAATAYLKLEQTSWAIHHLRQMVRLDRDNLPAQNKLAQAYADTGEYDKAIQIFNDLLKRDQVDSATYYHLAVCYAQQKMGKKATDVLSQASHLFGRSFVSSWIQTESFDPIREDPSFIELAKEVSQAMNRGANNGVGEQP